MVDVVQLVRASDCGSECRGFESHYPPYINPAAFLVAGLIVSEPAPLIYFQPLRYNYPNVIYDAAT